MTVSGLAEVRRIRQDARSVSGSTVVGPLAPGSVGSTEIRIPGELRIKTGNGTNGTSLLGRLPDFQGTGKLDLADSALVVDYAINAGNPTSPLAAARAQILSGYVAEATPWTGKGITSSAAAANVATGLGYAEASEALSISGTNTAAFRGVTADATSLLVRHTLLGDATLNGVVDFEDLVRLAQNYNTQVSARAGRSTGTSRTTA